MSPLDRPHRFAALTALAIIAIDQVTKYWAIRALSDGPVYLIGDVLGFELARNTGAAFGILRGAGGLLALLAVITVAAALLVVGHLEHGTDVVAVGLVLGGAAGNLIDRVLRGDGWFDGAVVDFVANPIVPNFNVADSAIVIGVGLILLGALRRG